MGRGRTLWNNLPSPEIAVGLIGFPNIALSIMTENTFGGLVADPLFKSATNYRLKAGSPAISLGLNSFIRADLFDFDEDGDTTEDVPWDLDELPRVQNGIVEAGAYEF